MANEIEGSLGDEQTRMRRENSGTEPDTARSLGDSQTLVGGLVAEGVGPNDELALTDLSARYTITRTLGQGGMGEVLLAIDNRLKRQVAIKRIRGEQARSRAAVQRFLTEAQAIAALNHPNIVQIYDYGRDQEGPFLIMEYVDGQSLQERCKDSPLPVVEAIELACDLLSGLARAHELGIIHRDIKPANILLTKDGRAKLTDFGLAKQTTGDQGQTVSGVVLGTIDFMPPEQRRDATLVDARSDLWSLAATVYQMLTGKSPKIIRLDLIAPQLVSVLGKALEDDPSQRFESAVEFREGLRRAMDNRPDILSTGECPQCGKQNDASARFCMECSGPLRTPCLECQTELSVWDSSCRKCGTVQAEIIAKLQDQQQRFKSEIEALMEAGKFKEASKLVSSTKPLQHPQLKHFSDWLVQTDSGLRMQLNRNRELADACVTEAKAHRSVWDYRSAIRAMEKVPHDARTSLHIELHGQLTREAAEAQKVVQEIQDRVKARRLDGLLPLVKKGVELRGDRDDLRKLLVQLEQREFRLAEQRELPPIVAPLDDPFGVEPGASTLPGFLPKQTTRKTSPKSLWLAVTLSVLGLLGLGGGLLLFTLRGEVSLISKAETVGSAPGKSSELSASREIAEKSAASTPPLAAAQKSTSSPIESAVKSTQPPSPGQRASTPPAPSAKEEVSPPKPAEEPDRASSSPPLNRVPNPTEQQTDVVYGFPDEDEVLKEWVLGNDNWRLESDGIRVYEGCTLKTRRTFSGDFRLRVDFQGGLEIIAFGEFFGGPIQGFHSCIVTREGNQLSFIPSSGNPVRIMLKKSQASAATAIELRTDRRWSLREGVLVKGLTVFGNLSGEPQRNAVSDAETASNSGQTGSTKAAQAMPPAAVDKEKTSSIGRVGNSNKAPKSSNLKDEKKLAGPKNGINYNLLEEEGLKKDWQLGNDNWRLESDGLRLFEGCVLKTNKTFSGDFSIRVEFQGALEIIAFGEFFGGPSGGYSSCVVSRVGNQLSFTPDRGQPVSIKLKSSQTSTATAIELKTDRRWSLREGVLVKRFTVASTAKEN